MKPGSLVAESVVVLPPKPANSKDNFSDAIGLRRGISRVTLSHLAAGSPSSR